MKQVIQWCASNCRNHGMVIEEGYDICFGLSKRGYMFISVPGRDPDNTRNHFYDTKCNACRNTVLFLTRDNITENY